MNDTSRTASVEGVAEGMRAAAPSNFPAGRRMRRNLAIGALVLVSITSASFWLAASGVNALPQAPVPSGTGPGGHIAVFTPLSSTVTIAQGQGAQLVNGILMGKVVVAAGFSPRLQLDFAWLDPKDAGAVLNNPNSWITFGLYYPIHTGSCASSGEPSGSQTVTDNSTTMCAALNTQATGHLTYNGRLTVNNTMLSGSIIEAKLDPSTPTTCAATGSTWCAPSGIGLGLNQNVFYITSSVNTPGGVPPAQQSQLTSLSFYIGVHTF
ncbi:MAG TPA: hypothetical protein VGJ85_02290 [Candidatus Nanopelagicaceae bacterium]